MKAVGRRSLVAQVLSGLSLLISYGLFGGYAVAYLFPPRSRRGAGRLFVGRTNDFSPGSARPFVDQKGRRLLIIGGASGSASGRAALEAFDTRCPHLGCRVHWEPQHKRFFCPCHNGVFDQSGIATAGPPAAAGQSLTRVPLEIDARSGTVFLRSEA